MDSESFWMLIEKSRRGAEHCDEQAENLTELLLRLESQEIADFDRHMRQCLSEAYRWDMWAVAYIINGGCSDDCFESFRGWLIAQGKEYFEAALLNPERAAKRVAVEDVEVECESILYAAREAYEQKTGEQLPPSNIMQASSPAGQAWDEDEVEQRYPKLARKFGG